MFGLDPRVDNPRDASPIRDLGKFSDPTLRNRRNLLVVSAITIAVLLFGITADRVKFFGVELTKADTPALRWILFAVVLYNFTSYFWSALNEAAEWRWSYGWTRIREMTDGWQKSIEDACKTIKTSTGDEFADQLVEHALPFVVAVYSLWALWTLA
jgi:hypothetical protein